MTSGIEQDFYCRNRNCKFHQGISKSGNVFCNGNPVTEIIEDNKTTCYTFEQVDK